MGGRGARFHDVDSKGYEYGTKYHSFAQVDDIKFIIGNKPDITDNPIESMVAHRKYAVFTEKGVLKSIVFMDKHDARYKQIDFTHSHDGANPHTHLGYVHKENGTRLKLSRTEKSVYNKVKEFMANLTVDERKEIFK